jgi:hypothetical protein
VTSHAAARTALSAAETELKARIFDVSLLKLSTPVGGKYPDIVYPTPAPTPAPTMAPTLAPTNAPTVAPTLAPTNAPTLAPTASPTKAPTPAPSPGCVDDVSYYDATSNDCVPCADDCGTGTYRFGCGHGSAGTCEPCNTPSLNAHHASNGDHGAPDSCKEVCDAGFHAHSGACVLITASPTSAPTSAPTPTPPTPAPIKCFPKELLSGVTLEGGGGAAGERTYTSPNGWTVTASHPTYNNGKFYWLSNLIDGSNVCDMQRTCSKRNQPTSAGGLMHNCYWMPAGTGNGARASFKVKLPKPQFVKYMLLDPKFRPGGTIMNFRVLADGTDITPAALKEQLGAFNQNVAWTPDAYKFGNTAADPTSSSCKDKAYIRVEVGTTASEFSVVDLEKKDNEHMGFGGIRLFDETCTDPRCQDDLVINPVGAHNFLNNYGRSFVRVTGPEMLANTGAPYKFTNLPAELMGATMWKARNDIHSQPGAAYARDAAFKFVVSAKADVYYAVTQGSICCGASSNPDFNCPAKPGSCYKAQTVDGTKTTGIPCYYKNSCDGSTFPCRQSAFECVPSGFEFVQNINKVVSGRDSNWLLFKKSFAAGAEVGFSPDSRHDYLEMGLFIKADCSTAPGILATVNFETCFDLATGDATDDDDGMECPATGVKFPYNSNTVPHARTWWSEKCPAALVNKPFSAITAADTAGANFCNHINDVSLASHTGALLLRWPAARPASATAQHAHHPLLPLPSAASVRRNQRPSQRPLDLGRPIHGGWRLDHDPTARGRYLLQGRVHLGE